MVKSGTTYLFVKSHDFNGLLIDLRDVLVLEPLLTLILIVISKHGKNVVFHVKLRSISDTALCEVLLLVHPKHINYHVTYQTEIASIEPIKVMKIIT